MPQKTRGSVGSSCWIKYKWTKGFLGRDEDARLPLKGAFISRFAFLICDMVLICTSRFQHGPEHGIPMVAMAILFDCIGDHWVRGPIHNHHFRIHKIE